ncbi:hypothetical protein IP78_02385 [Brevundimonas sp. AAP58]|nr:hypothetical protein IP78_02385 [Brevundimonas sp. AAP58]
METIAFIAAVLILSTGTLYAIRRRVMSAAEPVQSKWWDWIGNIACALVGLGVAVGLFAIRMVWDEEARRALLVVAALLIAISVTAFAFERLSRR